MAMVILFALTFFLFYLIPFKNKVFQFVVISLLGVFIIAMMFVPSSWVCSIHLPVIDCNASEFVEQFLYKTQSFKDIVELAPTILDELMPYIQDLIKACFVFIFVAISLVIITLVSFIIKLFHKSKQLLKTSLASAGTLFMCVVILIIPLFNVYAIVDSAQAAVGEKDEYLYVTYPEYKEYEMLFNLIEDVGTMDIGPFLTDMSVGIFSKYGEKSEQVLIDQLATINPIITTLDKTGLNVIYEDPNFDFRNTKMDTFDFDKIVETLDMVNRIELYKEAPIVFANQIMAEFEKIIKDELGVKEINLKFTSEELSAQIREIVQALKFIIKTDVIYILEFNILDLIHMSFTEVIEALVRLVKAEYKTLMELPELIDLLKTDFVKKIFNAIGEENYALDKLVVLLFICTRAYTGLNNWLVNYRETSLYQTCKSYLEHKNLI